MAMDGKKILAAMLGGLLFFTGPAATMLPQAYAAAKKAADTNKNAENGEKKPPRKKGGRPEVLTYERAMEIESKRHAERLERIRKHYRNHPPKRREAIRQENAFHAKRIEEINKKFGMA